jgi:hypothetical protein
MTEADIEIILQGAKEKYPEARPRIISDNGPQFIAKDFKEFIRISGMTHVRTSPFYPQSNGKIERWHKSLKGECIRPGTPLSLEDARRLVSGYVDHYNNVRLNSATGYITPKDMSAGRRLNFRFADDPPKTRNATRRGCRPISALPTQVANDCPGVVAGVNMVQSDVLTWCSSIWEATDASSERLLLHLPSLLSPESAGADPDR